MNGPYNKTYNKPYNNRTIKFGAHMENDLSYENAYAKFKSQFPEDQGFFERKEKETCVDPSDGAHLPFGMVVVPFLFRLVDISDEQKIRRCFAFFEKISLSSDKELSAVVQFSILEAIVDNESYFKKLKPYFAKEMLSYFPYLHLYMDFD